MSMLSDKALTDILVKHQYKYKDQTKRDVSTALSYFKDLSIKPDHHVYPNGLMKDLVSLYGTIPVNFRNNTYNIPVQLFLSENHPYEPPLVYVRPTPDMSINVSEQVDSNGRVNMPALREWHYPKSDLYMLLNMMAINFSQATPLYSKSSNRPSTATPATNPASINPPYPVNNASNIPMPPYPVDSFARPSYPLPGMIPTNPVGPPPPTGAYPTQPPYPANPYYPQPLSHIKNSNSNSNLFGQTRPTPPYPGAVNAGPLVTNPVRPSYTDDTIKPEHFRMSLISAVQDKIRIKFKDACEAKRAEIDSLKRINNDLEMSQRNLTYLITDAENECMNIDELTNELKRKCSHLNESINRQQLRGKADIEDAVVTPAPLYRQLLQLFAEEMAIQDLIFYLGEGLTHQTITLDNFLKQIRLLTRKQFFLRATMQLAREKAGLAN